MVMRVVRRSSIIQAPMPNIIANVRRLRSRELFVLRDQSASESMSSKVAARCLCISDSIVEHLAKAFKAALVWPVL